MNITQQEEFELMATQQPIDDGAALPYNEISELTGAYISYRQWLAMAAMQGLVSNPDVSLRNLPVLARQSLDIADAMIAVQKKGSSHD
jgi:hypothetical protein